MFVSGFLVDRMNRPKVLAAIQDSCSSEPPPLTGPEMQTEAGRIAEGMGIESCKTTKTNNTVIKDTQTKVVMGLAGSHKDKSTYIETTDTGVGCETVAIAIKETNNLKNAIACTLNNSENEDAYTTKGANTVSIIATGPGSSVRMNCGQGALKIDQNINIKAVILKKLDSKEETEMAAATEAAVKNTAEAIQKIESGTSAVPIGGKSVDQQLNNIINQDFQKKVKNAIAKMEVDTQGENEIKIMAVNGGIIDVRGAGCEMNQNVVIDLVAQNLASNIMNDTFSSVFKSLAENSSKIDQDTKALGVETLIGKGGSKWMTIIGFIVVAIIGMVVLSVVMGKKKDEKKQSGGAPSPPSMMDMRRPRHSSSGRRRGSPGYGGRGHRRR